VVVDGMARDNTRALLIATGSEPIDSSAEKLDEKVRTEFAFYGKVIKAANIRVDVIIGP